MKYRVDVDDQQIEVEVREGPGGLEVSVAGGPFSPARLAGAPAPLHTVAVGAARASVLIQDDPLDPSRLRISAPAAFPARVRAQDTRTLSAARGRAAQSRGPGLQRSAMPGVIVDVRVEPGQEVSSGDVLLILEAMKMQNEIKAERCGTVKTVHVSTGEAVPAGAKLVEFQAAAAE